MASRAFSISGVPDGTVLHPGYVQGTFVQFAADAMSAVRFAVEGDVSAIRAASPELATLAFDPAPPIVPPFTPRDAPITVTNPIAGVHAQIETFLRTRIERGRASIE